MNFCVLMTACIDPSAGWVRVHRSDARVRLADYLYGLRFWLELPDERIDRIVFVENSGYDLDELRALAAAHEGSRPVEFISTRDNHYPPSVHYGYAELGMVDRALAESRSLRQCSHFIKATGRLAFPTIGRLLDRLPDDCRFAVDSRNSTFLRRNPQVFVTTQLMVFGTQFYRSNFVGIRDELNEHEAHIERLFWRKLMPLADGRTGMMRWPVNVDPAGMAAHWEKRYDAPKQKMIGAARALSRAVFPNWWI